MSRKRLCDRWTVSLGATQPLEDPTDVATSYTVGHYNVTGLFLQRTHSRRVGVGVCQSICKNSVPVSLIIKSNEGEDIVGL